MCCLLHVLVQTSRTCSSATMPLRNGQQPQISAALTCLCTSVDHTMFKF